MVGTENGKKNAIFSQNIKKVFSLCPPFPKMYTDSLLNNNSFNSIQLRTVIYEWRITGQLYIQ